MPPYSAFVFTSSLPDSTILGDLNLDGFINVLDVVLVVGCIVGFSFMGGFSNLSASGPETALEP